MTALMLRAMVLAALPMAPASAPAPAHGMSEVFMPAQTEVQGDRSQVFLAPGLRPQPELLPVREAPSPKIELMPTLRSTRASTVTSPFLAPVSRAREARAR